MKPPSLALTGVMLDKTRRTATAEKLVEALAGTPVAMGLPITYIECVQPTSYRPTTTLPSSSSLSPRARHLSHYGVCAASRASAPPTARSSSACTSYR